MLGLGKKNTDISLSIEGDAISKIQKLQLAFEAGFNERAMNKYMEVAALAGAEFLAPHIAEAAPVGDPSKGDPHPGRLRGAVRAKRGRYKRPSAIAGIYKGKSRSDETGAYYARAVTAGAGSEAQYPGLKRARGLLREYVRRELGIPANRQGVRYANQLAEERNLFARYSRTPVEGRPFVAETGERYRDELKGVVQDKIEQIIQDDAFRGTIRIGKGRSR